MFWLIASLAAISALTLQYIPATGSMGGQKW